jgi:hypothetical protein
MGLLLMSGYSPPQNPPHRPTVPAPRRNLREPAHVDRKTEKETRSMSTILLIVLVLILLGALPSWPYSRSWGYAPSGTLGLVLVVVILLALTGRI